MAAEVTGERLERELSAFIYRRARRMVRVGTQLELLELVE
jgi:hypothetical protein